MDLPRICEGNVVVPLLFGGEGAAEDVVIFTAVAHVASKEEPKIRSPVIIVQAVVI